MMWWIIFLIDLIRCLYILYNFLLDVNEKIIMICYFFLKLIRVFIFFVFVFMFFIVSLWEIGLLGFGIFLLKFLNFGD